MRYSPNLSSQEIEKLDKLGTAAHKAVHLVVAAVQGCSVRARLWRTGRMNSLDTTWTGNAEWRTTPTCTTPAIAVAGWVAECLIDDECWDHDAFDLWGMFDIDDISPTDRQYLGDERGDYLAIEEALTIIRSHRPFFDWAMNTLIQNGYISDGDVDDYLGHESPMYRNQLASAPPMPDAV